jgi:hypothetical protein
MLKTMHGNPHNFGCKLEKSLRKGLVHEGLSA